MPLSGQFKNVRATLRPRQWTGTYVNWCTFGKDGSSYPTSICGLLAQNACITTGYMLLAQVVRSYFDHFGLWPAPLWLPAGLGLFAAIRGGLRWAPGIFLGSLATNLLQFHDSFFNSFLVSIANTAGPFLATVFARSRIHGNLSLEDLRQVTTLILSALFLGVTSSLIAVPSIAIKHPALLSTVPSQWLDWCLSDTAAALLVTPLLMVLTDAPSKFLSLERKAEFGLTLLVGAITLVHLVSGTNGPDDAGSVFLVLVPLLWLAVRFSIAIAYPIFAMAMTIIIMATMHGMGPFWGGETRGPIFVFAEMSVGFGMAILLLGSAASEQRKTANDLLELNRDLETRVNERTAELQRSQAQLERAALQDPLTGLPNRRSLENHFAICEATARRKNRRFTILLIDLDHFKQINDHFGHDTGDVVLIEAAIRLRDAVRQCDIVARLGGDEFMLLLPETSDRTDVETVCQRLSTILANPIAVRGKTICTNASIGIAMFPDDVANWQTAYKAADLALYQAKRSGRGTWRWYDSSCVDPPLVSIAPVHV